MAKRKQNTFDDVKMLIATLSISMTLAFWHIFSATANAEEQVAIANLPQATATLEPVAVVVEPTPAPTFTGKILLGGEAPQPKVVVQRVKVNNNNNNGGNNGGGNNGGGVTQTQSS